MDLDFFDSYSITACRIDCETRYLVENCNCRMVHMPGQAPKFQTRSWAPQRALPLTGSPCMLTSANMQARPAGFSPPQFQPQSIPIWLLPLRPQFLPGPMGMGQKGPGGMDFGVGHFQDRLGADYSYPPTLSQLPASCDAGGTSVTRPL